MDAVEEVKSRLSIEDVIGEYVQLKRAGHGLKGISPFTNEKTASFMVSPEKQIWHDFSAQKGGNMFGFVMEMEGLDFKGALELLARKAGVDLTQYRGGQGSGNARLKERLYAVNEVAARFYQVQFSKNRPTLEYVLKTRDFSKQTALTWRLGYAPNGGTVLIDFLKTKNFTQDEIKRAGLSTQRGSQIRDMFRGRLMIPLCDPQGQVIGFTARLLSDEPNAPKYINTPSTLLYDKSRHVYGLHLAKEAIRRGNFVVVAEGNLDVIASHQAGVANCVATAGTALTDQHLKIIGRFTPDIRLCFDADDAGVAATERAIPIAAKVGVSLSVIPLPSSKDPDELIKQGTDVWQHIIEKPVYALDWLIKRYSSQLDLTTGQGKRQFSDIIIKVISGLSDQVEQEHYIDKIAKLIGVSREAMLSKLRPTSQATLKRNKVQPTPISDKDQIELTKIQDHLLALAFKQSKLRDFLAVLTPEMLVTDNARQLLDFLQKNLEFTGTEESFKNKTLNTETAHADAGQGADEQWSETYHAYGERAAESATPSSAASSSSAAGSARGQATTLRGLGDYAKILALEYEELYEDLDFIELRYEAARLQARLIERYVKTQKKRLGLELAQADDKTAQILLTQAKKLDQLLKLYKGETNG